MVRLTAGRRLVIEQRASGSGSISREMAWELLDEIDRLLLARYPEGPCVWSGCVSRERHSHGGFPGGYENPEDPHGPPIEFTREPAPGVRDYNGAILP